MYFQFIDIIIWNDNSKMVILFRMYLMGFIKTIYEIISQKYSIYINS